MTMPRKRHRPRADDWSQAMTWTIRIEEVSDGRRRRAAGLDRALRLIEIERRRSTERPPAIASEPAELDQPGTAA